MALPDATVSGSLDTVIGEAVEQQQSMDSQTFIDQHTEAPAGSTGGKFKQQAFCKQDDESMVPKKDACTIALAAWLQKEAICEHFTRSWSKKCVKSTPEPPPPKMEQVQVLERGSKVFDLETVQESQVTCCCASEFAPLGEGDSSKDGTRKRCWTGSLGACLEVETPESDEGQGSLQTWSLRSLDELQAMGRKRRCVMERECITPMVVGQRQNHSRRESDASDMQTEEERNVPGSCSVIQPPAEKVVDKSSNEKVADGGPKTQSVEEAGNNKNQRKGRKENWKADKSSHEAQEKVAEGCPNTQSPEEAGNNKKQRKKRKKGKSSHETQEMVANGGPKIQSVEEAGNKKNERKGRKESKEDKSSHQTKEKVANGCPKTQSVEEAGNKKNQRKGRKKGKSHETQEKAANGGPKTKEKAASQLLFRHTLLCNATDNIKDITETIGILHPQHCADCQTDGVLSSLEMELAWLCEESMYCLGCQDIEWSFIWKHASQALKIGLRKDTPPRKFSTDFDQKRKDFALRLNRGYRRPEMAKHVALCRLALRQGVSVEDLSRRLSSKPAPVEHKTAKKSKLTIHIKNPLAKGKVTLSAASSKLLKDPPQQQTTKKNLPVKGKGNAKLPSASAKVPAEDLLDKQGLPESDILTPIEAEFAWLLEESNLQNPLEGVDEEFITAHASAPLLAEIRRHSYRWRPRLVRKDETVQTEFKNMRASIQDMLYNGYRRPETKAVLPGGFVTCSQYQEMKSRSGL